MFNNTDTAAIRLQAALELLRHKFHKEMEKGSRYPSLEKDDIEDVMVVAGMKLDDEVEVIDTDPAPEEEDE